MCKKFVVILMILILPVYFLQVSLAEDITRSEIQNFFESTPGNASYKPDWQKRFLHRNVSWKGIIFSIQYQKDFNRTEITLKILPGTFMYDTIVYVPGDITDKFKVRDEVNFSGSITRGVDMLGVKEVQVSIGKNLGDSFGDYIFAEDGMVNVNFLKTSSSDDKQE